MRLDYCQSIQDSLAVVKRSQHESNKKKAVEHGGTHCLKMGCDNNDKRK